MSSWVINHEFLIGQSHLKNDISCQDFVDSFQNDELNITVLSDGCGSSKHSDIGSKIVVKETIRLVSENFELIINQDPIESRKFILSHINRCLQEKADEMNVSVRELNATLLFVAVKSNEELLLGHLGDGYIGSINESILSIKSMEKKDAEVNGTYYTTTENAYLQFDLRKGKSSDYSGFILMSDGPGDALVDSRIPFKKKFIDSVAGIMEHVGTNDSSKNNKMLKNYIKKVRDFIQTGDDCSISIMIKENTKAPLFKIPSTTKSEYSLKDSLGKYVVIYFYPKDDTPGCTIETNDFNKLLPKFKKLNCDVFGVSKDNIKSHDKFRDKYKIKFDLLSDEDLTVLKKYKVWAKKKFMGREFMGILRTTFLIDPKGKIIKIWENVKVKDHAKDVLDTLNSIQK